MSQTKVWTVTSGTTVRRNRTNGATAGQGQAKRWFVGTHGGYDYDAYVKHGLDWSGVGRIVSVVLNAYTDDGLAPEHPSSTTEHPHVIVRRLIDSFTEGNSPDGTWQTNDYTIATGTTSDQRSVDTTRESGGVNNIDVTAIFEDIAPKTVKRRNGQPCGNLEASGKWFGLGLFGTTNTGENWGLYSDKWTDPLFRPTLTLTYEFGLTTPDTPSGESPNGVAASLTDFQASFSDPRPTDTLKQSGVQVFDAGAAVSSIGTDGVVHRTAHGLTNGAVIYFTSLTGGAGLSTFTTYYVRQKTTSAFRVATTNSDATIVNVTNAYSAATLSKIVYNGTKDASRTEIDNDRFVHVPDVMSIFKANTTYRWRSRVKDQEGQWSAWSNLVSFSFTNTAPNAPTLTPANGYSTGNPDSIVFRGTFHDADGDATMIAYEVQMSAYASGDPHWDDAEFILWNTGKRYITPTTSPFETPYGGPGLAAGTYYWRARVYDDRQAPSDWTYASITFTDTFEEDPDVSVTAIQLRPRAPWRIVIKGLGTNRGPGSIVAVIEDAKNVGASELYNSPGELHFTLPKGHPQISALEPRQTHYSVQFRTGDGWYEKFAGLMTDFDANDVDIVFYGIDYLGLLDFIVDERYDPSNAEKASELGGSKYVTTNKNSIGYIVRDQLVKAAALSNSPVGFIAPAQSENTLKLMLAETLTVYSTYAPVLQFVVGLLDSHRAGSGKRTRLKVRRSNSGGYEYLVTDNPGQVRDNLRMRYGELVAGYRVVAFGADWATRVHGIGRAKDGIKVMYDKQTGQGIPEATWGRFTRVQLFDGVSDPNDFKRRIRQAAAQSGKLGKQIGLGLRSNILQPKDGYDVCDKFPIDIEDGSVSTEALHGSSPAYWVCVGITWQTNAQDGKQETTLSFQPQEDTNSPSADLLTMQALSTQKEWQIGWTPPPITASSRYWLDQTTGITYIRTDGILVGEDITGTA